jgi:hypothetical protein
MLGGERQGQRKKRCTGRAMREEEADREGRGTEDRRHRTTLGGRGERAGNTEGEGVDTKGKDKDKLQERGMTKEGTEARVGSGKWEINFNQSGHTQLSRRYCSMGPSGV